MEQNSINLRTIVLAFFAAAIAVAVPMNVIILLLGRPAYVMTPTAPFGVPQFISAMFFGGLWGIVFTVIAARFNTGRLKFGIDWLLMGAILATGVLWFVVFPLKGRPVAGGFAMPGLIIGPLLHAAWAWAAWMFIGMVSRFSAKSVAAETVK